MSFGRPEPSKKPRKCAIEGCLRNALPFWAHCQEHREQIATQAFSR